MSYKRRNQIYCSVQCRRNSMKIQTKICFCLNCKKEMIESITSTKKFCSEKCATTYKQQKSCVNCGKTFIGFHTQKYCSTSCQLEYKSTIINRACKICGEIITLSGSNINQRKISAKYCSRRCANIANYEKQSKTSNHENSLIEEISKFGIEDIIHGYRPTWMDGYELDIYLPDYKLAIEFDGLYWHSEICGKKDKWYHLNKTKRCSENGIHLVHIFEDEWITKRKIVLSRLKNLLRLNSNRIYARNCSIKSISSTDAKTFVNETHTQGYVSSAIKYGAFYNGELVAVMTFGKQRKALGSKSKENEYELLRFSQQLNTSCIGIASKMFKKFVLDYNPKLVISYADKRWTVDKENNLYTKLGFVNTSETGPNYWYTKDYTNREYRFKYRKSLLVKDGFDETKTEKSIMLNRKFDRIWDCGSFKFEYNL